MSSWSDLEAWITVRENWRGESRVWFRTRSGGHRVVAIYGGVPEIAVGNVPKRSYTKTCHIRYAQGLSENYIEKIVQCTRWALQLDEKRKIGGLCGIDVACWRSGALRIRRFVKQALWEWWWCYWRLSYKCSMLLYFCDLKELPHRNLQAWRTGYHGLCTVCG